MKPHEARNTQKNLVKVEVPVLPNRFSYFIKREENFDSWTISSSVLEASELIDPSIMHKAYVILCERFDSLRLEIKVQNGKILQHLNNNSIPDNFLCLDYGSLEEEKYNSFVEKQIALAQKSIKLPDALFKILLINNVYTRTSILFIVIHHLIADAYSFSIVIDFMISTYIDLKKGTYSDCSHKNNISFLDFSRAFIEYQEKNIKRSHEYWNSFPWDCIKALPVDYPGDIPSNLEGSTIKISKSLDISNYQLLIKKVANSKFSSLINMVVYSIAIAYKKHFGCSILNLALVHHNRSLSRIGLNLSQTVGWISEAIPLIVQTNLDPEICVENIKQQLDIMNREQLSFSYLKYISNHPKTLPYKEYIQPEISLNFIPLSIKDYSDLPIFNTTNKYSVNYSVKESTRRVFLISGGIFIKDGKFILSWDFSCKLFKRETIDLFGKICIDELEGQILELINNS